MEPIKHEGINIGMDDDGNFEYIMDARRCWRPTLAALQKVLAAYPELKGLTQTIVYKSYKYKGIDIGVNHRGYFEAIVDGVTLSKPTMAKLQKALDTELKAKGERTQQELTEMIVHEDSTYEVTFAVKMVYESLRQTIDVLDDSIARYGEFPAADHVYKTINTCIFFLCLGNAVAPDDEEAEPDD